MNRLTIKLLIATLAILTTVSFTNHAEAQTPPTYQSFATSSAYITGASGRYYITPFAGFGVSMLPDSCFAYANIASDTTKITYLLTTQIKDMMTMYNNASCNTETTPSPTCTSYIDTINNLTLTYATYQVEGMKQAKEKTYICNADNTRKPNVYKKTYYGIDIVALTYASVRDAYVNKKFTDYTTLINNVKTNLTNKLNAAITADRFVDVPPARSTSFPPAMANLRTLAEYSFKTTSKVVVPRTRVVPPPASTVLSMPNAFLFFGQTNNVSDKTIGAIPMNSLQEYANTFNANKTRFGDIYSSINKPLLTAGSNILTNINRQVNLRLPPMDDMRDKTAPTTTPPIVQQQPPTQKASVINSIGNWFGGIWGAISDFFGYMFWGESAGAKVAATTTPATASGSGPDYAKLCPAMPNPVPKPDLDFKPNGQNLIPMPVITAINFKVPDSSAWDIDIVQKEEPLDPMPKLTPEETEYLRMERFIESNKFDDIPCLVPTDSQVDEWRKENLERELEDNNTSLSIQRNLSNPSNPYDCMRSFNIGTAEVSYAFHFDSVKFTVTALDQGDIKYQTATKTSPTKVYRGRYIDNRFKDMETMYIMMIMKRGVKNCLPDVA